MNKHPDKLSVADILGPWVEPDWDSGLIDRCRRAWNKPLKELSREEMATLLRQRIAVEHILPIAQQRLQEAADDDTEMYEGELAAAIEYASRRI
jgi:contact-dependent growth inhibition (CDI) system CdiI-like immunity protein